MRLTHSKPWLKLISSFVLAFVIAVSGIAPQFSFALSAENIPLSSHDIVLENENALYIRSSVRKVLNRYFNAFGIKKFISATEIELDRKKLSLTAGTTALIDADVVPSNSRNTDVIFKSDNPTVATVNIYGRIKGLKPGNATVYAIAKDGGFYEKCFVTVTEGNTYCDFVALSAAGTTLETGACETFDVTIFPVNTTDLTSLIVSDINIVQATLSDGKLTVTGKTPGTAIVTVKCGNIYDTLYVNVVDSDNPSSGIDLNSVAIFGGTSDSNIGTVFRSVESFADGGYITCGTTASANGNFEHLYRTSFGWKTPFSYVAKFSASGAIEWIKLFGSSSASVSLYDIAILSDGSIATVGTYDTPSTYEQTGGIDAAVIRLSPNGALLSNKILEGSGDDFFYSVSATSNGYVVGGKTTSINGAFEGVPGMSAIVMNYDLNNTLLWKRYLNASKSSHIADIDVDGNDNIFLACVTTATDGQYASFDGLFGSYADTVILKYSYSGDLIWHHVLATSGTDLFDSITADGTGGCYVAGNYTLNSSVNPDGTLEGIHNCGGTDSLVFHLNQNGERLWHKILAGFYDDFITDITCTDSGVCVTGYSDSSNRDFSTLGNQGGTDGFICFYDTEGNAIEIMAQAGTKDDAGLCIAYSEFSDEIFVAGRAKSSDGSFGDNPYGNNTVGYVGRFEITTK